MSAEDTFVPTVTAISSTPDFQWMVQPTIITSVSPSPGGKQANEAPSSRQATPTVGGSKGRNAARKGKAEQVGARNVPFGRDGARRLQTPILVNSLCAHRLYRACSSLLSLPYACAGCVPSFLRLSHLYSGHSKSATMVYF